MVMRSNLQPPTSGLHNHPLYGQKILSRAFHVVN